MMTFTIKFNEDFTREYVVAITDAPRSYDGFGTINLKNFGSEVDIDGQVTRGDARMVLIEKDHLEWQRYRYFSGMHPAIVDGIETHFEQRDITETIYNKLRGNND